MSAAGGRHPQVFVVGCERSGTTALALMLASHFGIVIGMERYRGIYRHAVRRHEPDVLVPDLFEQRRFFSFDPEETRHIPPETRFTAMYEAAAQRFTTGYLRWVGDKVFPADPWLLTTLADRYPGSRFLFIWRDPVRVANSFELRARNPEDVHWPPENDHRLSIDHWNGAVGAGEALAAHVGRERMLVVQAERLFGEDIAGCHRCLRFLDLDPWSGTDQAWSDHRDSWQELQARPLTLTDEQRATVEVATSAAAGRMVDLDRRFGLSS